LLHLSNLSIVNELVLETTTDTKCETEIKDTTISTDDKDSEMKPSFNFDPFEGIGETKEDYGIDDILEGCKHMKDKPEGGQKQLLASLLKMAGLDNIMQTIDKDKMKEMLDQLDGDHIEEIFGKFATSIGMEPSDKTLVPLKKMLINIINDLKTVKNGDYSIESITKILENTSVNKKEQRGLERSVRKLAKGLFDVHGSNIPIKQRQMIETIMKKVENQEKEEHKDRLRAKLKKRREIRDKTYGKDETHEILVEDKTSSVIPLPIVDEHETKQTESDELREEISNQLKKKPQRKKHY